MVYYYIFLLIILIFGFFQEGSTNEVYKRACSLMIMLVLLFFSMYRHETVGSDTLQYMNMFDYIKENFDLNSLIKFGYMDIEKGYLIFNYIASFILPDSRCFIYLMTFVTLLPFFFLIEKFSPSPWLSYYIFVSLAYYNNSMFIYRQFSAISILIFSLKFVRERKCIYFLALCYLAYLFHKTAICFIPIYWFYQYEINKWYIVKMFIVAMSIFLLGSFLINIALSYARIQYETGFHGGLNLLLMLTFLTMGIYRFVRDDLGNKDIRLFFHMMVFATLLQILSLQMLNFVRAVYYFEYSLVILVPCALSRIKKQERIIGLFFVLFLFLIIYYSNLQGEWTHAYKFMWE